MKRLFPLVCVLISVVSIGCAVHDGHEDEPAPIWWPTFLYRPTTHPTEEEYDQTDARPTPPWQNDLANAVAVAESAIS